MSYQSVDKEVIDYQIYCLGQEKNPFRGPKVNLYDTSYISFLGAAQTFGRFVENPFPKIVANSMKLPCLNLGIAGCGPEFYIRQKDLINIINQSKIAVIQVMSGRSVTSPWIQIDPIVNANLRPNPSLFSGLPHKYDNGAFRPAYETFSYIYKELDKNQMKEMIEEHRQCWVNRMIQLAKLLTVPKILFYFSRRKPEYESDYSSMEGIFGEDVGGFPQLVNQGMLNSVKPHFTMYLECVSDRGYPSIIRNVKTGVPVPIYSKNRSYENAIINYFYPSPEMHEDAGTALTNLLDNYLKTEVNKEMVQST